MRPVALVGGAVSPLTKLQSQPSLDLARTTIDAALADAGIDRGDLDCLAITPPGLASFSTSMFVSRLGAYLGQGLRSLVCLENGGCSSALALRWALLEVGSGRCDVAVALGIDQRLPTFPDGTEIWDAFMDRTVFGTMAIYGAHDGPYGLGAPIPYYAMSTQRYMYETGATAEDLAWVAVQLREHAHNNPRAVFAGKPLTVQDVLESKVLSPPLHLADCSQFVSGASAVVVASEDVARSLGRGAAWLRGFGEHHHPSLFSAGAPSLTRFASVQSAAHEAYEDAGVSATDIDVAEIYGVFTGTELILCEDLGFFGRGEAAAAFREGRATYGGDIVIDPTGGRLSCGHPACATPLIQTVEILEQLRGSAGARQTPGATLGLVHAEHGMLNGSIVCIFEGGHPT